MTKMTKMTILKRQKGHFFDDFGTFLGPWIVQIGPWIHESDPWIDDLGPEIGVPHP